MAPGVLFARRASRFQEKNADGVVSLSEIPTGLTRMLAASDEAGLPTETALGARADYFPRVALFRVSFEKYVKRLLDLDIP